ncbi:MAG: hypothetical protein A2W11_04170 [Ignavibacteria bacterium RBG_16_35_7]|nr:MAG: hypothetical protein A2W11_04170 [Ignavibacteria bacterium RBG_16_35_7]
MFTVWDSLDVQQFTFTTDLEPFDLVIDPYNWILKNLIEGDLYTVEGQVIDIGDSTGIGGAEVYWAGPFDPFTGAPLDSGVDTTDANGYFQFEIVNGDYGMQALKDGYLMSRLYFNSVSSDTSGLILTLSQPQASYNLDLINFTLEGNQVADTILVVSNVGTGDMFIQTVEADFSGDSHKRGLKHLRYKQFPFRELLSALPPVAMVAQDPIDSLWVQVHHDIQEDPSNQYDLANTYAQDNGGTWYLKLTTHVQPATFNNMRINIIIDADNDFSTGDPSIGA